MGSAREGRRLDLSFVMNLENEVKIATNCTLLVFISGYVFEVGLSVYILVLRYARNDRLALTPSA